MEQQLPQGSWTGSARDYYISNGLLSAELRSARGEWIRSSTPIIPNAHYGNADGAFQIESMPLPGGSWSQTARGSRVIGNVLHAQLQNERGAYIKATLLLDGSNGEFANENGRFARESVVTVEPVIVTDGYKKPSVPAGKSKKFERSVRSAMGSVTSLFGNVSLNRSSHPAQPAAPTYPAQPMPQPAPTYQTPPYQPVQPAYQQPYQPPAMQPTYAPTIQYTSQPMKQQCFRCKGKGWSHDSNMNHNSGPETKCFFCDECKACGGLGHL